MGPVQEWDLLPEKVLRHGLVGRQHEIFDQKLGRIPLVGLHLHRPALFVQRDLGLRKIEVDAASLVPPLPQDAGQLLHPLQHGQKLLKLLPPAPVLFHQHGVDIGITHAPVHPDHSLRDLMIRNVPLPVDPHDTGKGQPVLSLIEGADAVGKLVGQHGNHPVQKIHGGSPP